MPEPRRRSISARKCAWRRPHAIRKPAGFVAARPGDLVEVDTLDIRPVRGEALKQFTACDVISRRDVLEFRLFVLPPRSPKLNAHVERANRNHTEESYEIIEAEPELAAFQVELRAWETVYDTIRPHQSLGYLTPAEYLASVGIDV